MAAEPTITRTRPADRLEGQLESTRLRLRYERALVQCSRALLTRQGEPDLEEALMGLRDATEVEWVVVDENFDDPVRGVCSRPVAWVARSEPPADLLEHWTDTPWSDLPAASNYLARGIPWSFTHLDQLDPAERAFYTAVEPVVCSEIDIPVFAAGRWAGVVSLFSPRPGEPWKDWKVEILMTVADMIGSVWERRDNRRQLEQAASAQNLTLRFERARAECSAALLTGTDHEALDHAVEALLEATGTDYVFVERNVIHPELGFSTETVTNLHSSRIENENNGYPVVCSWTDFPDSGPLLERGEMFIMCSHDDVSAGERSFYEQVERPLQAEIDAPIFVAGQWRGLIGLATYEPRMWTAAESHLVEEVARMIGAYWERRETYEGLAQAIRDKDRFIASVSHELRTPLAAVVGFSAELRDQAWQRNQDETNELLDLVARQAVDMASIVEDLLVAARADESLLTVFPEMHEVNRHVHEVVAATFSETRPRVVVEETEKVDAWVDSLRFRQIVRNLLTNATRHGGPIVTVRISQAEGWAIVEVADNGPGIPPEVQEAVFTPYYTLRPTPGLTGSIGLGLTVGRQLARLMGGDVTYRHNGESVFTVTLPQKARES
jgi:signal transduction histidine kinase